MSNALAIASVTKMLKHVLDNANIGSIIGNFSVSLFAPVQIKENYTNSFINLYLYNVILNAAWRNIGLPSHDWMGNRCTNPPLALDLYYILTAYGKDDYDAEKMLGHAMQAIHENSVPTRETIRLSSLDSGLADQLEMIKITPHQLSTEDISKLWTAFSAPYHPSVAYHVSVILIEGNKRAKSPLPVLTRGPPDKLSGREGGVTSQPSLRPKYPTLVKAKPPNQQTAVRMGEELTLIGYQLEGDSISIRFTHMPSLRKLEIPAKAASSDEIRVNIPVDPSPGVPPESDLNSDNWAAGIYRVAAIISKADQAGQIKKSETNELPLVLAPRIDPQLIQFVQDAKGNVTKFTTNCSPKIWLGQTAKLIIGSFEISAKPIPAKSDIINFNVDPPKKLSGPKQLVRLQVDGAESIFIDRNKTPPEFDNSQRLDIP
jgi:hypothetical protein